MPTAFRLCTIEPGDPELALASLFNATDKVRLKLLLGLVERFERPPPMLCGACDHDFTSDARPALLYWTEPMFPKVDAYRSITGVLCAACAADLDAARYRIARFLGVTLTEIEGTA
jgi:hypothetical protein